MARDNYSYKKFQKELAKKKKAEEKKLKKLERKALEAAPEPGQAGENPAAVEDETKAAEGPTTGQQAELS